MTRYVLDASVAAKWILTSPDEKLIEEAAHVFRTFKSRECELLVPDLFWIELGNIFWKSVRQVRISQAASEEAIRTLMASGIPTIASSPLVEKAFRIASGYQRSVYDAVYVALAADCKCDLLTADERLYNALGSRFPIRWLGAL